MMFDDDESGVAAVTMEMTIIPAALADVNVHHEMMLVMMDMTVLKIAETVLMVMVISITMMTAKMTVMMMASSPDNDASEYGVFGGDGGDDDNDGDEDMVMLIKCWWAIDRRVLHALKLLMSSATARSLQQARTQKISTSHEKLLIQST